MSIRLINKVWQSDLDGMLTAVASRLAGFADDDGKRIYPTIKRIAADLRINERTVQRAMRKLEEMGLLVLVAEADARAQRPRQYRIDVSVLDARARQTCDDRYIETTDNCEADTPPPVADRHPPGGALSPPPVAHCHPPGGAPPPIIVNSTVIPVPAGAGAGSASDVMALGERIAAVTGWDADPAWTGNFSRLFAWLARGWDAEADVLPTVARLTADRRRRGQGPPRGLEYFEAAVADAFAARTRPVAEGNQQNDQFRRDPARSRYRQEQPGNRFTAILQRDLIGHA